MRYTTKTLLGELILVRALEELGIRNPNLGVTDIDTRKQNFRLRIIAEGIGHHEVRDLDNRVTTIEKFFRDIYREDLKNG